MKSQLQINSYRAYKALIVLTVLIPALALATVSKEQNWAFSVDENTKFSIDNVNGDIKISAADGDQLLVTAKLKADNEKDMESLRVDVKESDGEIIFKTIHGESGGWFNWGNSNSGEVEFTVTLPAYVPLKSIGTVNGDVEITGIKVSTQVSTVNGDLELNGVTGNTTLDNVNGDISVEFLSFSGSQEASIQTVNGTVVVYLPADASTKVNAETVNGSIRASDFDLKASEGSFVGSSLDGKIGSGSATLSLTTVNGSIKVKGT